MSDAPYIGFADGACRSTHNLSSAAWVIYDPHGELIDLQGVCLGCTTNNVAEYSAVIEQLVIHQLNGWYSVRDRHILRLYLHVRLLERNFDFITYKHIPRQLNTLTDALANHVLDRYLRNR